MKKGFVLEGGAMRGLFSAGVMDVLMENNIWPDGAFMIQPIMFVSMRMERRMDDSVISRVSVSRLIPLLFRIQKFLLIVSVSIVHSRLKQPPLPVAHSFTVLMLSLHWQRENKSKVYPYCNLCFTTIALFISLIIRI